jgi:hypothetical protein
MAKQLFAGSKALKPNNPDKKIVRVVNVYAVGSNALRLGLDMSQQPISGFIAGQGMPWRGSHHS